MIELLYKWQTLIGSFLGPFLAVAFSVIGYFFIESRKRKESMRIIEVSLTQTLNDLFVARKTAEQFLKRVEIIMEEIQTDMDKDKYVLTETNLPPINIYLDEELPKIKTKSYYVHNKLLIITGTLKNINTNLKELKNNFSSLAKKNEFLIHVEATHKEQKQTYLANLKDFYRIVEEDLIKKNLNRGTEVLVQTKIYNQKLMKRWSFIIKWKYEGVSFKYFKNNGGILKDNRHMSALDRIDEMLKQEVECQIKEAEDRQKQFN
ncbi:MAG: hypothetical protein WCV71_02760 [Patescibacteria group bacterium]